MPVSAPELPAGSSIQTVLDELDVVIDQAKQDHSRRGFFAAMYRTMTYRVQQAIVNGDFQDPVMLEALDVQFARYYFRALRTPKRPWQVAFSAEDDDDVNIIQQLLLGMNAHINYDLPQAVVDMGVPLHQLEHDYGVINDVLAALADDVQGVLDAHSPVMNDIDSAFGRVDETVFCYSAAKARDVAWSAAHRVKLTRRVLPWISRRTALLSKLIIATPTLDIHRHAETDYNSPAGIVMVIEDIRALAP
ncbi:MAG: hypothetical protein GY913_22250 [Proteobacteria bacterium]|nr:hypothetical protein [Pseudomonadota bacterium]MCP4919633.1 hypothetical protein [Pseudomonadota bacterium]